MDMRFKKLRLWAAYPFALVYLFFVLRYGIQFHPGIWVVLAGLLIRFWAAGYIKKIRVLTTIGPYAYVRNPLYVGNFLMGLGFCLFISAPYLALFYSVVFAIFYAGTVKKEETLLTDLFGADYVAYKKAVPAFIPRLTAYPAKERVPYSLSQAHYNGEFIRVLVTALLLCLLYVVNFHFRENLLSRGDLWRVGGLIVSQLIVLGLTIAHRKKLIRSRPDGNCAS